MRSARAATGFFTTIRRTPEGKLTAVPYSLEYQGELAEMSRLLREAAALTKQPTLKSFLEKRADAFIEQRLLRKRRRLDGARRVDRADDRAVRGVRGRVVQLQGGVRGVHHAHRREETRKLERFSSELQELEDHLPIDKQFRKPKLGGYSPIRVVNVVFAAGDGNHGVQTAAFNLPNDEKVVAEKGSKRVLLKNFQEAKFEKVLQPIAGVALTPAGSIARRVRAVLHAHPHA